MRSGGNGTRAGYLKIREFVFCSGSSYPRVKIAYVALIRISVNIFNRSFLDVLRKDNQFVHSLK